MNISNRLRISLLTAFFFGIFPVVTHAAQSIQEYAVILTTFVNNTLLPFVFAIALLFFLINIVRYFIIKGADPYEREQAKKLALYGFIAFVFLVSIWVIVNIILNAFDLRGAPAICPDYNPNCGTTSHITPSSLL